MHHPDAGSESETSLLPSVAGSQATSPSTVLPTAQGVATTAALKKPKWTRVVAIGAVAAVTIGIGTYLYLKSGTRRAIESIAVMPFVNESRNPEIDYLSDGMTETLISSLSQLPNVSVKARSSVYRFKDKPTNAQTIGRELNVQAVLNGRLIQRSDQFRLSLELVDARTENIIWVGQYDRKQTDLASLQRDIALDVSAKIRPKLSGSDEQRVAKSYQPNSEAYQAYLKGRFYWNKRTPRDLQKAVEHFQAAIRADPNYALAFAGLADGYTLLATFGGASPREAMPQARALALKAIALDPQLAEPHVALGHTSEYYDYNFIEAERFFQKAIELNPNYAPAHEFYGTLLSNLGRHQEAEAEFRRALELEPLSLGTNRMYGEAFLFARRYDEAIAQLKKTIELDGSFASAHRSLGRVYFLTGNYAGHVDGFARYYELIGEPQYGSFMRETFAKRGWRGYLQAMTGKDRPTKYFFPFNAAIYFAELGNKDQAFAELNKTYDERLYYIAWMKSDPSVDRLRDDARFQELLKNVTFP